MSSKPADHTDMANAALFARMHGDRLRHIRERRSWYVWTNGRWRRDITGDAQRAAKETARHLWEQAFGDDAAVKWAVKSQQESRLRAMLDVAATEPEVAIAADDLDRDPWLLSCGNGTLDLRAGRLRDHQPDDLISLGTEINYDPTATCARWITFLSEVFDFDAELVAYVRRADRTYQGISLRVLGDDTSADDDGKSAFRVTPLTRAPEMSRLTRVPQMCSRKFPTLSGVGVAG